MDGSAAPGPRSPPREGRGVPGPAHASAGPLLRGNPRAQRCSCLTESPQVRFPRCWLSRPRVPAGLQTGPGQQALSEGRRRGPGIAPEQRAFGRPVPAKPQPCAVTFPPGRVSASRAERPVLYSLGKGVGPLSREAPCPGSPIPGKRVSLAAPALSFCSPRAAASSWGPLLRAARLLGSGVPSRARPRHSTAPSSWQSPPLPMWPGPAPQLSGSAPNPTKRGWDRTPDFLCLPVHFALPDTDGRTDVAGQSQKRGFSRTLWLEFARSCVRT